LLLAMWQPGANDEVERPRCDVSHATRPQDGDGPTNDSQSKLKGSGRPRHRTVP